MEKAKTKTAKTNFKPTLFKLTPADLAGLAEIRAGLGRMTGLDHTTVDALRYAVNRVSTDFQVANASATTTNSPARKIRK